MSRAFSSAMDDAAPAGRRAGRLSTSRRAPDDEGPPADGAPEGLALGDVGRLLRRHWLGLVVPTLLAVGLAVAFVQIVPPRYTAETKLLLESRDSALTRPQQERGEGTTNPIDEQAVASQVQVVMSRDIAREAIRRLHLVGNPEFDPLVDGVGPVQRLLMMLGLVPNPLDREPEDRVLERYFDRLLVYAAGKSRVLTIEFRSRDPDLAARAANTIADLYIASLAAAKVDTARYASTWLGSNIEALRSRVAEAEAKVESFRARNGLIGAGGTTNQPLGAQQLAELSTQLTQARAAQADAAAKAQLIREMLKDGRSFEIPDVANNELIRRLVEQRITLRAQLALESRTLLPQHPRIKELNAQLNDLEGQIRGAADRTVRTLENDARIAGARVDSLRAAVDSQREVVAKGNTSEVELRALEREARAQREQLESYLSRYREASARDAASAAPADARVVSQAVVPETPSFPKKLPIVALAGVLTFLLAAGVIVARALLSDGPPRRGQPNGREPSGGADLSGPVPAVPVRRAPAAPRMSAAPAAEAVQPAPATAAAEPVEPASAPVSPEPAAIPPGPPAPAYDLSALTGRLQGLSTAGDGRRILVVADGDGLADLAASLARGAAASGERAVLIRLGRGPAGGAPGLTDLMAGTASFGEAIQPDGASRLHVIGRGRGGTAALLAEGDGLGLTLDALGQTYGWVVCGLDGRDPARLRALTTAIGTWMDAVVIASNAAADDPGLLALFEAAEEAGVPDVVVARDGEAMPAVTMPAYPLRRSA
ncbi:GumC family protein [uncultured Methylobacterium sp.]|jgi:succinoglycan biosynthesis transport protein ExoP|uniref:GumC family protein n=1 Tax=uncultured Methylobacterium sp. TaxID=157278 RepID=UPI0026098A69|nr:GumC family protein [uncultured Methylobacterium sp.]